MVKKVPPILRSFNKCFIDLHNGGTAPYLGSHSGASHNPEHPHSRSNVAMHTRDAAPSSSFWSSLKAQRMNAHCKKFMNSLMDVLKRKSRQTRNTQNTAIVNDTTDTPPTDCNAIQNHTWGVLIYIAYAPSALASDTTHAAIGAFDSQCAIDMMSRRYAEEILGARFDNTTREPVGYTITNEPVFSVGRLKARWTYAEDVSSSSPGSEPVFAPLFYDAEFFVVESDHFEVIIGHPSLEKYKIYERKVGLMAPFRSLVSSANSSAAADAAQDQAHAAAMAAERACLSQFLQQQVRSTDMCGLAKGLTEVGPEFFKEVITAYGRA